MNPADGVIERLRQLVPFRRLSWAEALQIAEMQANRFRYYLGISSDEVPESAISGLPRLIVTRQPNLSVSGFAQLHHGRWIVAINSSEPRTRQRFSLAHELFHVINHATHERLHPGSGHLAAADAGERLADFFAGCMLMPRFRMKHYYANGEGVNELASRFDVSPVAISVRLRQLGLIEPTPRCRQPINSFEPDIWPQTEELSA